MKRLILFLLFVPGAFALNCTDVQDSYLSDCGYVYSSSLSAGEKNYLIQDLIDGKTYNLDLPPIEEAVIPDFGVETDKLVYGQGEKIKVSVEPSDHLYVFHYANKDYVSTGSIELKAVYPYNRIEVRFGKATAYQQIHVKNDKPLGMLFSIAVFSSANYTLVGLIRKFWGNIW